MNAATILQIIMGLNAAIPELLQVYATLKADGAVVVSDVKDILSKNGITHAAVPVGPVAAAAPVAPAS